MNSQALEKLFNRVRSGRLSAREAVSRLREGMVEELADITLDHQRALRKGFPEVVFGEFKTDEQILAAVGGLAKKRVPVVVTRTLPRVFRKVAKAHPTAVWNAKARAIGILPARKKGSAGHVGVLAAGTSDVHVAEEAAFIVEAFGVRAERRYDVGVAGLHRLLRHRELLLSADAFVVVAGMEGALPSVVAGLVEAPVFAVPTSVGYGVGAEGLAALAGMLSSCSPGVAVVNIDNGFGAGYLAANVASRARSRMKK